VRGVERFANLDRIFQRWIEGQWSLERRTLDVLHHQIIRTDIMQRADVRVIQCRDDARFAFEALGEFGFGDFQRDDAVQSRIAGFVHFTHAPCTHGREDFIWPQPSSRD
jgi:hypothetical protein